MRLAAAQELILALGTPLTANAGARSMRGEN
jgi:hypothetical protein